MLRAARPGRTGGEVYQLAMDEMKRAAYRGQDLLAPDWEPGPRARRQHRLPCRPAPRDRAPPRLRKGAYMSIELNTLTPVPSGTASRCSS